MRYPEFLKENGTIGFPAPSFGCSTEPYISLFKNAQKNFRALGHGIVCGPNAYVGDGIGISTAPEKCGKEFTDMYTGDGCDVLISCGGGELMCEILDHVDFDAIRRADPKWFMGYSDNTNLSFLLATLCDTASVYGPCVSSFGMEPQHPALQDAYDLLRGKKLIMEGYPKYETESLRDEDHPLASYNCTEPRSIRAYIPKALRPGNSGDLNRAAGDAAEAQKAEHAGDAASAGDIVSVGDVVSAGDTVTFSGRLIGGCLDILANLAGTCYDRAAEFSEKYREDGIIWFLEACDLNVFGIRRAIWELQHAGWFSHVKGFLIGRPLAGAVEMMGLDHIRAVTDLLEQYGVPVLLDVDLGHVPPMMPVIVGSMAEVSWKPETDAFRLKMELR